MDTFSKWNSLLLLVVLLNSVRATDYDYATEIPNLILAVGSARNAAQIHVAYLSTSPDYLIAAQTIQDAYNTASASGTTQQQLVEFKVQAFFIPQVFPFNWTLNTLIQLFNYQTDIMVGENHWAIAELATLFNVPYLQIYSSFPNPDGITGILQDFVAGFFSHSTESPSNQFYYVYESLKSSGSNYYYYEYESETPSITPSYGNYSAYPSNNPAFNASLITYNPLIGFINKIDVNITVILDANMPNQEDMNFFQSITTSAIAKASNIALYILTIPINPTQQQLDQFITSISNYTGPRFVYATYPTALALINSISNLGAFSTSLSSPSYQWHFLNYTGGTPYDPAVDTLPNAPYIYHWELFNLTQFAINCPQVAACTSCYSSYNRLMDCDLGLFLGNLVASYAEAESDYLYDYSATIAAAQKQQLITNLLANPSNSLSLSYASGLTAYVDGLRVGMTNTLYLGVNQANSKQLTTCSHDPSTGEWTCTAVSVSANSTKTSVNKTQIFMAAYMVPPYFYVNPATGQYTGFFVALASLLAEQLNIADYVIYGVSQAGSYNSTSGNWTGVIGAVLGPADIGMSPLTVINNLTTSLAFSNPYASVTFSVLQQVADPTMNFGDLFNLIFRPFNMVNWILQAGCIIFVSLLLSFIDHYSPNVVAFNPNRSWFYVFARSVLGAGGQNPDVFSSQLLVLFWSFVTMITISTYTANLIALSVDEEETVTYVETLSDLLSDRWNACYVGGSYTAIYFMSSTVPLEMAVWNAMSDCNFATQTDAVSVLSNWSDPTAPNIALLTLQPQASYIASQYVNIIISANYSVVNLVLAVPNGLNSAVKVSALNNALTQLIVNGSLTTAINQYMKPSNLPFAPTAWTSIASALAESETSIFTFQSMSGIFLIIAFGMMAAIVTAAIERAVSFIWHTFSARKQANMENFLKSFGHFEQTAESEASAGSEAALAQNELSLARDSAEGSGESGESTI